MLLLDLLARAAIPRGLEVPCLRFRTMRPISSSTGLERNATGWREWEE